MAGKRRVKNRKNSFLKKYLYAGIFLLAAIILFAGWKIWNSDAVQMRFVYMWPYQQEILYYSERNKIDPFLVAAIIKNESGYDGKAVSHVGAVGLMQIMPETGQWIAEQMGLEDYHEDDLYLTKTNIRMGCWYVGELEHEFQGNLALAVIAYNAGRGQTKMWMDENQWDYDFHHIEEIPYPDTKEYVAKVLRDRDKYYLYYRDQIENKKI